MVSGTMVEFQAHGERIIASPLGLMVESKSHPGEYHTVSLDSCTCESFAFRGRCRHVTALHENMADAYEAEQREQAEREQRLAANVALVWGD